MRNNKENFRGESADFVGQELEEAYATAVGGKIIGGRRDAGKDILTGDKEIPYFQVKSSYEGVKEFVRDRIRKELGGQRIRDPFIPLSVGEVGTKEEIFDSMKKFGIWVGQDIPNREEIRQKIAKFRDACYSGKGFAQLLKELA